MIYPGSPSLIGSQFYGVKTRYLEFGDNTSNDYVNFTEYPKTDYGTLELWFYKTLLYESVFIYSHSSTGSLTLHSWLAYNKNGYFRFFHDTGNNEVQFGDLIDINKWYHVVITSNGTSYKAYINGVEQSLTFTFGSSNNGAWFGSVNSNIANIGRLQRSSISQSHNFIVDEVRIWNHARTPEQIKRYMNTRLIGNPALHEGLVAYYPMDEGTGTTVFDRSQNSNDGTLVGGTWITP